MSDAGLPKRRNRESFDAEDAEQGISPTNATVSHHRLSKQSSGKSFVPPDVQRASFFRNVTYLMLALFGVMMVVHMYQFSNYFPSARLLDRPFHQKEMVRFTTKHGEETTNDATLVSFDDLF